MIGALLETIGALSVLVSVAAKIALLREDAHERSASRTEPSAPPPRPHSARLRHVSRDDRLRRSGPVAQRRRRR